jgi:CIC family chloride channel protein
LEVDALRTTPVREVMSAQVETLPEVATCGEARRGFEAGRHSAYPVVDAEGRCVGMVSRGDLLESRADDARPVLEVASRDVVTVSPDDTVFVALRRIVEEGVEHLPVVAAGRLVGICTRTDVLRARHRQLDLEVRQPGWRGASATSER